MKVIFLILSAITVIGTILPFVPSQIWWIRFFEFPRYQLFVLGVVAIVLYILLRKYDTTNTIILVLIVLSLVYQATKIFPYTFLSAKQVEDSPKDIESKNLSILVSNVFQDNVKYDKFLDLVRAKNPDMVFLAEANGRWDKAVGGLSRDYPYDCKIPLENTYGMILYSKYKLLNAQVKFLIDKEIPSIHTEVELDSGDIIKCYFLHPKPPAPQESKDSKERDAEILIIGKEAANSKIPVIVAGDLNDVAWSETTHLFQKISKLLDPRIGRGFYNTFHADYFFMRWPLDYIFHSNHFKLLEIDRLDHIESDHFPMFIKLSYDIQHTEQEVPTADKEDKKEAQEKIEEGKNDKDRD